MNRKEFNTKKREVIELAGLIGGVEDEGEFVFLLPTEAISFFRKDAERILGQSRQIARLMRATGGHGSDKAYRAAMALKDAREQFANMVLAICLWYPFRVAETEWYQAERRTQQLRAFRCLQVYFGQTGFARPIALKNSGLPLCHVQPDMLEHMAGFPQFGVAERYIAAGNTEPPEVELGSLPISFS